MVNLLKGAIRKQEIVVGEDKLKPKQDIMADRESIAQVGGNIIVRQPSQEEANAIIKSYPGHNLFGRLSGKLRGKPSPTKDIPFHDFNLERIAASGLDEDGLKGLIDGVINTIKDNLDHNVTRTHEEVAAAAEAIGLSGAFQILKEGVDKVTLKELDAKIIAAGHAHVQLALAVQKSTVKFLNAKAAGATEDELTHLWSIAAGGMKMQGIFVKNLIDMKTAMARGMAASRYISVANERDAAPLFELMQRGQRLGHNSGDDVRQLIAEAYLIMPDPTKQSSFVRELASKGTLTANIVVEAYVNGLLANPVTHMVNILSNALNGAMTVPERALGAVAGSARARIRSSAGKLPEERIRFGEASSYAYALISTFGDAFRAFGQAYKTEMPLDMHSKLEMPGRSITAENVARLIPGMDADGAFARGIDWMGKWFVRQPGRLLVSEDEWFKAIFKRAEQKALAYRRGVELVEAGMSIEDAAREVVETIMVNPSQQVKMRMSEAALQRTYQQPLEGVMARMSPFMTSPWMKPVTPFYKTPTNIAKALIDRTPVPLLDVLWGKAGLGDGFIGKLGLSDFQKAMDAGGPAKDMALGKMAFGSMLLGSVWLLMETLEGDQQIEGKGDIRITGGWPEDKKTREAWQRAKIQPYSVHQRNSDGTWTAASFSRFEPLSGLLAMVADYRQLEKYETPENLSDIMFAMTSGMYNYVGSMPMMQAVEKISNAVAYRAKGVDGLEALVGAATKVYAEAGLSAAQNLVSLGTMPPTLTKLVQGIADPQFRSHLPPEHNNSLIMRNVWSALQRAKTGFPGFSQGIQPRLNRWAETSRGVDYPYLPIRIQTGDHKRVDLALVNMKEGVSMPPQKIEGVDLSGEHYNRWLELSMRPNLSNFYGGKRTPPTLLQMLDDTMFGRGEKMYSKLDNADKASRLQSIVQLRDKQAKALLYLEYPELKQTIDEKKAEREAGQTGPGHNF